MGDSETEHVVELQSRLAQRLRELGFGATRRKYSGA